MEWHLGNPDKGLRFMTLAGALLSGGRPSEAANFVVQAQAETAKNTPGLYGKLGRQKVDPT
jgi:hypothetical protein